MGLEIERKFLVSNLDFLELSFEKKFIQQGYLSSDKNRTIRIRISQNTAYLTIKGKSDVSGIKRHEWEYEIPLDEARELMDLCGEGVITKYRYFHKIGSHIVEIDEFLGENEGLYLAEIELKNEQESFEKPSYLGKEVTGNLRYYNSNLSKYPYKKWA